MIASASHSSGRAQPEIRHTERLRAERFHAERANMVNGDAGRIADKVLCKDRPLTVDELLQRQQLARKIWKEIQHL